MRQSLARYSAPVSFVHAPSLADFITTIVGFEVFGTHSGLAQGSVESRCRKSRCEIGIGGSLSAPRPIIDIAGFLGTFRFYPQFLDAHENGPRCAQISGPTVGARQRSPAVDLLVANEGWVIVLCQDRSRRRRWPKASLYKGLSPSHARPTDGHVGVCPARGCPRETRQSAPGWWVRKMSTPWVHSRERQGQIYLTVISALKGTGLNRKDLSVDRGTPDVSGWRAQS